MRIKLTNAQLSALECRPIGEAFIGCSGDAEEEAAHALLCRTWTGPALVFDAAEADALFSALIEHVNAEDEYAQDKGNGEESRRFSRGASIALGNLAGRVLRART